MSTTNPLASVLAPLLGTRVFLADDYPSDHCSPVLDDAFLAAASQRGERLFIEYPRQVGRLQFASPRQCHYERTIVFRPFGDFAVGEIMTMHSCWLRLPEGDLGVEPLLIAGVAAGYRKIAYEMPDGLPVLFFHPNYPQVLIASGCPSCFQRARMAPHAAPARRLTDSAMARRQRTIARHPPALRLPPFPTTNCRRTQKRYQRQISAHRLLPRRLFRHPVPRASIPT